MADLEKITVSGMFRVSGLEKEVVERLIEQVWDKETRFGQIGETTRVYVTLEKCKIDYAYPNDTTKIDVLLVVSMKLGSADVKVNEKIERLQKALDEQIDNFQKATKYLKFLKTQLEILGFKGV